MTGDIKQKTAQPDTTDKEARKRDDRNYTGYESWGMMPEKMQ